MCNLVLLYKGYNLLKDPIITPPYFAPSTFGLRMEKIAIKVINRFGDDVMKAAKVE